MEIIEFEGAMKAHFATIREYINGYRKAYAWMWFVCMDMTHQKLRNLNGFSIFIGKKELLLLFAAIKGTTLQFELHKDFTTALTWIKGCIYECKQEASGISTHKFVQQFLVKSYAFTAYGGRWAMLAILQDIYNMRGFFKVKLPSIEVGGEIYKQATIYAALGRIFLDNLNP